MVARDAKFHRRFRSMEVTLSGQQWDTGYIEQATDAILDEIYNQLDEVRLFRESGFVHVTFRGNIRANLQYRPLDKTFEMRQLNEDGITDLIVDIEIWAGTYIGKAFDYIALIDEIVIKFLPDAAGGCDSREHVVNNGHVIGITRRVKNNNCFFVCMRTEWGNMSPVDCDVWRRNNGLERGALIPLDIAVKHAKVFFNGSWMGRGSTEMVLHESHYLIYSTDVLNHRCLKCHKSYKRQHTCIYESVPRCGDCDAPHTEDVPCYIDKLDFVRSKRNKKTNRIKVPKPNNDPYIVLHYDIETYVEDETQEHTPFVVGYCWDVDQTYRYITGANCMDRLVNEIVKRVETLDEGEEIFVNAYNGARFDHLFLLKAFLRQGYNPDKFALSNGAIVVACFCKVINFWDMCRHLVGSLKENLKLYNCGIEKGDFNHSLARPWDEMDQELQAQCLEYLEADVLGMSELFDIIHGTILKEYGLEVVRFISTSQLTYAIWRTKTFGTRRCESVYIPTLKEEACFRKAIYGGRCYKVKHAFCSSQYKDICQGQIAFDDISDYVVDMDVVSLYPTAMRRDFPVGDSHALDEESLVRCNEYVTVHKKLPWIGIYEIKFQCNRNLCHAILPRRTEDGLKWTLEDGEGTYSSVDINNALRFGYTIQIIGGYYWTRSMPILKEYIDHLFKKKSEAEKGTSIYELIKLFLNALYGKMIQRPIFNKHKWCSSLDEFHKFISECVVHEAVFIEEKLYVGGYSRSILDIEKDITKPSQIGVFVLAYSREIMLNYFEKSNPYFISDNLEEALMNDIYYTDTDSMQVHVRNKLPFGKQMGCLDDDLKGGKIIQAFWIAPKLYCLEYVIIEDGKMKKCFHFRGKGVKTESLDAEMFQRLHQGDSCLVFRDFQMKRIGTRRNATELIHDCFSVVHKDWFQTGRLLNDNPWNGRHFFHNESVPFGSAFCD